MQLLLLAAMINEFKKIYCQTILYKRADMAIVYIKSARIYLTYRRPQCLYIKLFFFLCIYCFSLSSLSFLFHISLSPHICSLFLPTHNCCISLYFSCYSLIAHVCSLFSLSTHICCISLYLIHNTHVNSFSTHICCLLILLPEFVFFVVYTYVPDTGPHRLSRRQHWCT